jgi:RNA polymerase sigma-70 factor (ECF subfamily)
VPNVNGRSECLHYASGSVELQMSPSDPQTPERAAWTEAADLVHRIEGGDRHAEDEFIQRYRRGVAVIVARASRDQSAVEDLCQDALTTALEKIRAGAVRDPDRLSGFVAGLSRVLVIEHFRKQSSRAAIDASRPAQPRETAPTVVDHLLRQERATIVRAVLAELDSDRDREILFRFYIAEEDKDTICRDLDLTPLHFNRVLFRARERYRELYRQWTTARGMSGMPR